VFFFFFTLTGGFYNDRNEKRDSTIERCFEWKIFPHDRIIESNKQSWRAEQREERK